MSYEQILKANPYHGQGGRFTTQGKATFVSTGPAFAKSTQRSKDQWDAASRTTDPKSRAKGARDVGAELKSPQFFGSDAKVTASGDKVRIKTPIYSTERRVIDRNSKEATKDWGTGGLYGKYFGEERGIEINHVGTKITGSGQYRRDKSGKQLPPYYAETEIAVTSVKTKRKAQKVLEGWGAMVGIPVQD